MHKHDELHKYNTVLTYSVTAWQRCTKVLSILPKYGNVPYVENDAYLKTISKPFALFAFIQDQKAVEFEMIPH